MMPMGNAETSTALGAARNSPAPTTRKYLMRGTGSETPSPRSVSRVARASPTGVSRRIASRQTPAAMRASSAGAVMTPISATPYAEAIPNARPSAAKRTLSGRHAAIEDP